jgi:hypothetical protein
MNYHQVLYHFAVGLVFWQKLRDKLVEEPFPSIHIPRLEDLLELVFLHEHFV